MRRLLLTIGAIAAWTLYLHIGLAAILIYIWAAAMTSTANTAKTRALAAQHAALVSSVATTNQNLSATNTIATATQSTVAGIQASGTGTALPAGVPTGPPDAADCAVYTQTSAEQSDTQTGAASAGTAHVHDIGHVHTVTLPVLPDSNHTHDFDGHTHSI